MNALLKPLRQIARDLVEKKLWPIAAVLLAALVAVPVLIGGSSSDAPAPAPVAAAPSEPGSGASTSLVTVTEQIVTGRDDREGKIDDPIYDPPEPPPAESSSGAGSADATSATTAGGSPSSEQPAETTPAAPAAPAIAPVYYRTVVRWSQSGDAKARPISRLTPLGGLIDTAALYLGVTKSNATYAVFLLGVNATSEGEAVCEGEGCRVILLKSGQTQLVTVQPPDGSEARQYELSVVSAKSVETDAATARTKRTTVHPDGRDVMREMWMNPATAEALRPIQYDRDSGLLYESTAATPATAATAAEKASE